MKFEFDAPVKDTRRPIAVLYKFNGGPELCLAMNTGGGKKVWIYHDHTLPQIQGDSWGKEEAVVKKFYPGDKITITF